MATNSEILNIIRETSTNPFQTALPLTTAENIVDVGNTILNAPARDLEQFYETLVGKVGMQLFNEKTFGKSLGMEYYELAYGDTIEDIYSAMAISHDYVTGTRPDDTTHPDPFEVNKGEVYSAYYKTRLERQYTETIHDRELAIAFTSQNGLSRLVSSRMLALKNGIMFDDYQNQLSLMARQVEQSLTDGSWSGDVHLITEFNAINTGDTITTPEEALNRQDFLQFMANRIRKWSDRMSFIDTSLNNANVKNWTEKGSQKLTILSDVISDMDTNLLAWAYNQGRLGIGEVQPVDCWYSKSTDTSTVSDPYGIEVKGNIGEDGVPMVALLHDSSMFKIFTRVDRTDNIYNPKGHYNNTFRTIDRIYAGSPFTNFVAFFLD